MTSGSDSYELDPTGSPLPSAETIGDLTTVTSNLALSDGTFVGLAICLLMCSAGK